MGSSKVKLQLADALSRVESIGAAPVTQDKEWSVKLGDLKAEIAARFPDSLNECKVRWKSPIKQLACGNLFQKLRSKSLLMVVAVSSIPGMESVVDTHHIHSHPPQICVLFITVKFLIITSCASLPLETAGCSVCLIVHSNRLTTSITRRRGKTLEAVI